MMNTSVDASVTYFEYNATEYSYENVGNSMCCSEEYITWCVILLMCLMGVLGNGVVIWFLGFQMKRNPFSTFILNLDFADLGFLIALAIISIDNFINHSESYAFDVIINSVTNIMFLSSQFLLTTISVDRCVCVLFPIWHRCSRPNHLSAIVCGLLWIISFLIVGLLRTIEVVVTFEENDLYSLLLFVSSILCFPVATISAVILFIKLYLKAQQPNREKLLLMIFVTLLCFLILDLPLNISAWLTIFLDNIDPFKWHYWWNYLVLCTCLNSSINPVIYFLIGRKKQRRSSGSLKVILQNTFKEDEYNSKEQNNSNSRFSCCSIV